MELSIHVGQERRGASERRTTRLLCTTASTTLLTERELDFLTENLLVIADLRLIKVITHGERVVGFLFTFRGVSTALQRAQGRLSPSRSL